MYGKVLEWMHRAAACCHEIPIDVVVFLTFGGFSSSMLQRSFFMLLFSFSLRIYYMMVFYALTHTYIKSIRNKLKEREGRDCVHCRNFTIIIFVQLQQEHFCELFFFGYWNIHKHIYNSDIGKYFYTDCLSHKYRTIWIEHVIERKLWSERTWEREYKKNALVCAFRKKYKVFQVVFRSR